MGEIFEKQSNFVIGTPKKFITEEKKEEEKKLASQAMVYKTYKGKEYTKEEIED